MLNALVAMSIIVLLVVLDGRTPISFALTAVLAKI
jgi:hypothetical protein